ncbi:MAG: phytanoyl-CoA dioxygenase family protein [Lentisphaeria bacterium]|nr:phytanoyl-CoA dioxygenase family protein [Lentisphaeria bacterium]NQZ69474.1 phytanoyl-CoA dioxygenase family protein [Lentisphaeria bacterium]
MSDHGFTKTTSDGRAVIPLSDEERYHFDIKGWLAIKNVLEPDEIGEMVEFARKLKFDKESVPEKHRTTMAGPLEKLCDHPRVVGFMQEFLGHEDLECEEGYGFRMEYSFMGWRLRENKADMWAPHGGRGTNPPFDDVHGYQGRPGNAYGGLLQAVWELTDVIKGQGTHFVPGTHKGSFDLPKSISEDRNHPLWETYECPAGSIVFFSESVTHSGSKWEHPDHDRCAIFNSYNSIMCKYHMWDPHPDHLAEMSQKRASLFRPVHAEYNRENIEKGDELYEPRRGF